MLYSLHVKNLALIKEQEIEFSKGLNILTGETGAGKSVIIGSVNLALGAKADPSLIRTGEEYALVELVFGVENDLQRKQLEELEIPVEDDGTLVIQRKIMQGRSTSKVSGETVTAKQLKNISNILINIHGQNDHQELLHKKKHIEILDNYCMDDLSGLFDLLLDEYAKMKELEKQLSETDIDENTRLRETELLEYEVKEISDRVMILRKGQYIAEMNTEDSDIQEMTDMMVGHSVTLNIERKTPVNPKPKIVVEDLTILDAEGVPKISNVSFTANSGEILGIAGVSGCGQKELLEAIAGLQKAQSGHVFYVEDDGSRTDLMNLSPLKIMQKGVALSFVPEDRLGMGLVASMNIAENMMIRSFRNGSAVNPFTDRKSPKKLAETVVEELNVVTPSISTPVKNLSGGNVQKVLVGREIASEPKVLLTAYAVRGLDINSSYQIYDLINKQKEAGTAVIYVGEDLDVLLELSDRILVLCGGRVSGIIDGPGADKNKVGLMMTSVEGGRDEK